MNLFYLKYIISQSINQSINSNLTQVSSFNSNSTQNQTRVLGFTPKLELDLTQNLEFKTCFGLSIIHLTHCILACLDVSLLTIRLFKVRRHGNHDIVGGLCSELLMRLFYYIHLEYGKKFSSHMRIELGLFWTWVFYTTPGPER